MAWRKKQLGPIREVVDHEMKTVTTRYDPVSTVKTIESFPLYTLSCGHTQYERYESLEIHAKKQQLKCRSCRPEIKT